MRPDLQFIVAGDYNQLLPVCDRIEHCDYDNSAALYELVNGNRLTLTTCRRSDPTMYNMCLKQNIQQGKQEDLHIIKKALISVLLIRWENKSTMKKWQKHMKQIKKDLDKRY